MTGSGMPPERHEDDWTRFAAAVDGSATALTVAAEVAHEVGAVLLATFARRTALVLRILGMWMRTRRR
ncbi:hypothetical protein FHR81_003199 [Actinoalloteichus hoggarensis]|uniref:Uncharacterized protein n=1 Tax=Actinoalloteichus hoggarensis TaxID=1470176 RepID=A0A221W7F0_9PSEU|nr:hypothetical protein [Actinoalloteichus hoggarensis]ASO21556.1 hypothetical protein AHOG_19690 [Actinoalloteichus hoggarensis]MBB5922147.1 hypothetical protein [Actinoalloteichus hoggarensis]